MDPVEHNACAITEIPVEPSRDIVVLALVEVIQIQVGVSSFNFPGTWTDGTWNDKEI